MAAITLSVITGFLLFLALHVVIWRARPSNDPRIRLLTWFALVGLIGTGSAHLVVSGWNPIDVCAALWIEMALILAYFFVYAGVSRSVSVTVLSRLLQSHGHAIEFETLLAEYIASARFQDRLQLMRKTGLVQVSEDAVGLTRKGRVFSRSVQALSTFTCAHLQG